jgi:hypothetical protein
VREIAKRREEKKQTGHFFVDWWSSIVVKAPLCREFLVDVKLAKR